MEPEGFGFNLYQEKRKTGQFIGRVERDSPADVVGLKEDDKIVEVNGENISGATHKEVVARIKENGKEVTLLVVDRLCKDYHEEHDMVIDNALPYIQLKERL